MPYNLVFVYFKGRGVKIPRYPVTVTGRKAGSQELWYNTSYFMGFADWTQRRL